MGLKVVKFGGTSVADAGQLRKVEAIVRRDPDRRIVVVSAPGKRSQSDTKVTDLLYRCHECLFRGAPFADLFGSIAERYRQIIRELQLPLDLDAELAAIQSNMSLARSPDYAASRGEYLNAKIVAQLLGAEFIDAQDLIRFDEDGRLSLAETDVCVSRLLKNKPLAVIPGFYGATSAGTIKTFSRGGSDITGAILARGVRAEVYENWTDVSGVLMTDPRIVPDAETIQLLTYRELRELAYMGASVLHEEAMFPVIDARIPVNVRNTNDPDDAGTWIVDRVERTTNTITGIAGRRGYTVLGLERSMMNAEVGFGRKLLSILERHNVSFEHMPTGIDTVSLVIDATYLKGKLDSVLSEIRRECRPERIEVYENMALIATVGRGMMHMPGIASGLFGALASEHINVRMIDQGSSELNIIVGVEEQDFEKAIRAIYRAFVP